MKIKRLRIDNDQMEQLVRLVKEAHPVEACALLFGKVIDQEARILKVVAVQNMNESMVSFSIKPETLYKFLKEAEGASLELVGIFHSHPAPASPSGTDVRNMTLWPVVWLIFSTLNNDVAAYQWHEEEISRIEVVTESRQVD